MRLNSLTVGLVSPLYTKVNTMQNCMFIVRTLLKLHREFPE